MSQPIAGKRYVLNKINFGSLLELVSKELNYLAAILQHYAGSLIFIK